MAIELDLKSVEDNIGFNFDKAQVKILPNKDFCLQFKNVSLILFGEKYSVYVSSFNPNVRATSSNNVFEISGPARAISPEFAANWDRFIDNEDNIRSPISNKLDRISLIGPPREFSSLEADAHSLYHAYKQNVLLTHKDIISLLCIEIGLIAKGKGIKQRL